MQLPPCWWNISSTLTNSLKLYKTTTHLQLDNYTILHNYATPIDNYVNPWIIYNFTILQTLYNYANPIQLYKSNTIMQIP